MIDEDEATGLGALTQRFTLRHLQYFVAAAECSSIAQASERIRISSPSISAAIAHLEQEFGFQLFIRHHAQGLSLTSNGRLFLREARLLLRQADVLYSAARDMSGQVRGPLSLGCLITLAPMIIPELCRVFADKFPAVQIHTRENHQEALISGLRKAELDVVVTYDLQIPDDIEFEPLAELRPYALLPTDHQLARRRSVSLHELSKERLVLLDLPLSRDYFLSLFYQEGFTPNIGLRSMQPDVVRAMVANGHGYALLNARPRNTDAIDGRPVATVALKGDYRPMILGIASARQFRKPKLLLEFQEHCRRMINRNSVPGMVL